MRVLLINQTFYPDIAATAQHAHDLARYLVSQGHEVTAIASRSIYGKKGAVLPREEMVDGIRIVRVGKSVFGKSSIAARMVDFGLFYAAALWRSFNMRRQDVVICFTTPPFVALIGWLLRLVRGTRYIYWVMDLY
ncbi:MAG: glycosyltransferase, partial [bacterium]